MNIVFQNQRRKAKRKSNIITKKITNKEKVEKIIEITEELKLDQLLKRKNLMKMVLKLYLMRRNLNQNNINNIPITMENGKINQKNMKRNQKMM